MTKTIKKITSKLSKIPYLILFTILIGITVSSAYAITITLGGDAIVTEDLHVTGAITGPTITSLAATTGSSLICPAENVKDLYTIRIVNNLSFIELRSPTGPTMFDGEHYWINISMPDSGAMVPHESMIDRLIELGYVAHNTNTGTDFPLEDSITWIAHTFFQDSHTTICAES